MITFGHDGAADVRISGLVLDERARPRFDVAHAVGERAGRARASAAPTWRSNAAAALAVAGVVGVDLDAAATALVRRRAQLDADATAHGAAPAAS